MRKTVQYALDLDTGLTVSRVGSEVAFFELNFENGDLNLSKDTIFSLIPWIDNLKWTRKITNEEKNIHRKFWGMKPVN